MLFIILPPGDRRLQTEVLRSRWCDRGRRAEGPDDLQQADLESERRVLMHHHSVCSVIQKQVQHCVSAATTHFLQHTNCTQNKLQVTKQEYQHL